jgi:DNA-binding transcriptional regulator YiaG
MILKQSFSSQHAIHSLLTHLIFFRYSRLMTPSQCRAARALLNWTQDDLARAAEVGVATVRNFENEKSTPQRSSLKLMQQALEAAGIHFTNGDGPGVRLRKP